MKLIGFLMITLSSLICGNCYITIKKEREEELESFRFMLELIKGEITSRLCPLTELPQKLFGKVQGKAGIFLQILSLNLEMLGERAFEEIWSESLNACVSEFDDKEYDAINGLGKVLGRYEISLQCTTLDEVINLLTQSLNEERIRLPQMKRLSWGISASAGAMLAIMLI